MTDPYELQQHIYEASHTKKPSLTQIFQYIENNFSDLVRDENRFNFLSILHRTVQNECASWKRTECGNLLAELLKKRREQQQGDQQDETETKFVLQLLYQILTTISKENQSRLMFGNKVFYMFIDVLAESDSKLIVANILTCIHLYLQIYPQQNDAYIIEKLWNITANNMTKHTAQILVQLFDEFCSYIRDFQYSIELMDVIRVLLESEIREERKSAYYLMKKIAATTCTNADELTHQKINNLGWADMMVYQRSWSAYVTILENLDENQSHLILPSLSALSCIQNTNSVWIDDWMLILYDKLLNHNNILVQRWALEYFFSNFTCADLSVPLLTHLMEATNNTSHFNVEGYFLPDVHLNKFLAVERTKFFEVLTTINWRSVPLHFWLNRFCWMNKQKIDISKELLLKIAARVRILQNPKVRVKTIKDVCSIFAETIDKLSLGDYIRFVETLFNVSDPYHDQSRFKLKMEKCENIDKDMQRFSKRFYEIFTNLYEINCFTLPSVAHQAKLVHERLLHHLADVPKEYHGWVRFLLLFHAEHTNDVIKFYRKHYNFDLELLKTGSLTETISLLNDHLVWRNEEMPFVRERTVDFYVKLRLQKFCDLSTLNLDPLELLDIGTQSTLLKLAKLLAAHDQPGETGLLWAMQKSLKKYLRHEDLCESVVKCMLTYCNKYVDTLEADQLVIDILEIDLDHPGISSGVLNTRSISKELLLRGLLRGESTTGDAHIEAAYEEKVLHCIPDILRLRSSYYFTSQEFSNEIFTDLLKLNNDTSLRKPRYFENSKEHRLKKRIVISYFYLANTKKITYWSDELWSALLSQNNQLNISFLYELLIAVNAPSIEIILKKLRQLTNYTPSQQISVISVIYTYCMINWKNVAVEKLNEIINTILPLTMGANFQTRLQAQLVIYCILERSEQTNIQLSHGETLKAAIKSAFGEKRDVYLKDIRLQFPEYYKRSNMCAPEMILYATNAPFDEAANWCLRNSFDWDFQKTFDNVRASFACRSKTHANTTITTSTTHGIDLVNIQRKMNPTCDILIDNDLYAYPCEKAEEIFVIASLIDKLPNLGGIARTCEVLGIKNFIMDSKVHLDKADFKNLSMTAETNLNITEIKPVALGNFLKQKQLEGFKIVGAEQTANSCNFVNFEFPRKCILLLGHEKSGIPADLLGLLDYAVEIPQFGLVRSLNVHVTGALFMWEYCKQHIIKK